MVESAEMAELLLPSPRNQHSVKDGARIALAHLLRVCQPQLPDGYMHRVNHVNIGTFQDTADLPVIPCPLKEQEAAAAIRALEGIAVAALADLGASPVRRAIDVDISRVTLFLTSAYVTTLDGLGKGDRGIQHRIPNTDIHEAQSVIYRRLSANVYATKTPKEYYHIHGSLHATKTLRMLGLQAYRPDLQDYRECLKVIGDAVKQFDVDELEEMNSRERQAGSPVLTQAQFRATPHGAAISGLPPLTIHPLETSTPVIPFATTQGCVADYGHILEGVRVLELCRVLAGPVIGRSLAAYGASVLKVSSTSLPDVPFFQLDVNTGKRTASLNLKVDSDRAIFDDLLSTADVLIDGYRPGALARLGYGPEAITKLGTKRGRGFVYVVENCFGGSELPDDCDAQWAKRPGWQQIADCVTGVAWEQGKFMGLDEPVVPPFPISDYGTGALGCVAALIGLHRRATDGGSWLCTTSLCQYNLFLLSLGLHDREVQEQLRREHDPRFFALRHDDSVDVVSQRALESMKKAHPWLFGQDMFTTRPSKAFKGQVRTPKEALSVQGVRISHVRAGRPNGFDAPSWENWETDPEYVDAD